MGQVKNEQSKERWPRIGVGPGLRPNPHNGTTGSLPMDDLFRDPGIPPGDAAAVPAFPSVAVAAPAPARPEGTTPARTRNPRVDLDLKDRTVTGLPGWSANLTAVCSLAASAGVLWLSGRLPAPLADALGDPPERAVLAWGPLPIALLCVCGLLAVGCVAGLTRVRSGTAVVLHSRGRYRATLRRTGLVWRSPLRRSLPVDVRVRHWRSRLDELTDREGTPLDAVLLVIWQVRNTARALYAVDDHEMYLKEQVEAAAAQVFSTLPCDSFQDREPSLRDSRHLATELTQAVTADVRALGIEVYSVQVVKLEYAAHVSEAMRQRRLVALEAKHREDTLEEVAQAVEATMRTLTAQGGVEWDDYERKAFVRELTVAFYAARTSAVLPGGSTARPQPPQ